MIIEAAAHVGRPTMFSMLIIIIAHIPIFTLQRQEGRIFAPMAYTIVSALLGSLLFSLTLVPVLAYFLLRRGVPHGENRLVRLCKKLYRPVLTQAVRWPVLVLAAAVAALAGSLLLRHATGQRISSGAERRFGVGESHAAARDLGERSGAGMRRGAVHPQDISRKCAR